SAQNVFPGRAGLAFLNRGGAIVVKIAELIAAMSRRHFYCGEGRNEVMKDRILVIDRDAIAPFYNHPARAALFKGARNGAVVGGPGIAVSGIPEVIIFVCVVVNMIFVEIGRDGMAQNLPPFDF